MAYFPFYVDIKGMKCLIVGGGMVAYRKLLVLEEFGAEFHIVSPEMCDELEHFAADKDTAILKYGMFEDRDLDYADFVVCATDHAELNRHVSELCRSRRIPVNVVDVKEECSFIFPAIVRDGDITVGISTGGSSPAIAQMVKARIREVIPEGFGQLAKQLGTYRELVKRKIHNQKKRAELFRHMAEAGIDNGGSLSREQAERLIEEAAD